MVSGFLDVDRFALAVLGQPCGEPIGEVEQPGIAGLGGEQDQLRDGDDAAVVIGGATLNVARFIGQPKTPAFDDLLAQSMFDGFAPPWRVSGGRPRNCSPSCSAIPAFAGAGLYGALVCQGRHRSVTAITAW